MCCEAYKDRLACKCYNKNSNFTLLLSLKYLSIEQRIEFVLLCVPSDESLLT